MTAGLELVVAASVRVLHVGLGAVLVWVLLRLPSLLCPHLPCLPTRVREAFLSSSLSVRVCAPTRCLRFSALGGREQQKHFSLSSALQSLCQTPKLSWGPIGVVSGAPGVPGGGPQGPGLCGWLGRGEVRSRGGWGGGCGRKRDVVRTGGDECSLGVLGRNPRIPLWGRELWTEWVGFWGNGVDS